MERCRAIPFPAQALFKQQKGGSDTQKKAALFGLIWPERVLFEKPCRAKPDGDFERKARPESCPSLDEYYGRVNPPGGQPRRFPKASARFQRLRSVSQGLAPASKASASPHPEKS